MLNALRCQERLVHSMASAATSTMCGEASLTEQLSQAARKWTQNQCQNELLIMHRLIFEYYKYATTGSERFIDDPEAQAALHETVWALCRGWFAGDLAEFEADLNSADALTIIDETLAICESNIDKFWRFVALEADLEDIKCILTEDSALGQQYPRIVESSIPVGLEGIRDSLTKIYLEEIGFDGGPTHAALQMELLRSFGLPVRDPLEWTDWRPLAGLNLLPLLSLDRWQYPRFIGGLYLSEVAEVRRTASVQSGLHRVNMTELGRANYYSLHSMADVAHADELRQRVLRPMLDGGGKLAGQVVEGARLWVLASKRYDEYLQERLDRSRNVTKH